MGLQVSDPTDNSSPLPDRRRSATLSARRFGKVTPQRFDKINEMVCELASKDLGQEVQEQLALIRRVLDGDKLSKDFFR
jgi:hypothetical protein